MGTDSVRTVLEGVGRGELTADEAEVLLGDLDDADEDEDVGDVPFRGNEVQAVINGGGLVEVIGDDIDAAYVDGPHQLVSETGGQMIINVGDDAALMVPRDGDLDIVINAAEARIGGIEGTLHAFLNVGPVHVAGRLRRGRSSVNANAGNVDVVLDPSSDVTVAVRCAAAVEVKGPFEKTGRGQWTLGAGTAELEISGNLGTIRLFVDGE